MSRRSDRWLAVGAALVGACGLMCPQPLAAQRGDVRIEFMQQLMRAAFPALERESGWAVISMGTDIRYRWDRPFNISVDIHPGQHPSQSMDRNGTSDYLRGDFQFAADVFQHVGFYGKAVNQEQSDKLRKLVDSHLVTTDQQLADALVQLGAKFGPDKEAEFTAQLNLPRFEKALGKIEQQKIEFQSGLHSDPSFNFPARWAARLRTRLASTAQCFVLQFEPFGGQLVFTASGRGLSARCNE